MLSSERQILNCFSTIGKGGRYDLLGKTFRQQTNKICQMVKCEVCVFKNKYKYMELGEKKIKYIFFPIFHILVLKKNQYPTMSNTLLKRMTIFKLYTYLVSRVTYTDKYHACIWTSYGKFRYERYESVYINPLTVLL